MSSKFLFIFSFVCLFLFSSAQAAFTIKDGKLVDANALATMPAADHFDAAVKAYEAKNWSEAAKQFRILAESYPTSPYSQDAQFFLGVAEFYLDEMDFANEAFNTYIKSKNNPKNFQNAIEFKFAIADKLAQGMKCRLFGTRKLPKWSCGKATALQIYDEVIAALPCHDLAAKALFAKGNLQWDLGNYRGSIEAFQMLIKRFPKHELAPESYVAISKVYIEQSAIEFQNPDILAFAQINLRRFKQDFAREERIAQVEKDVLSIKEVYAQGLYNTGQFYERTGKPLAAVIYYQNAIKEFPETNVAQKSRQRLDALKP